MTAAFVGEGAEDLFGVGGGEGADMGGAGGAVHDFVGVEEALPVGELVFVEGGDCGVESVGNSLFMRQ